MRYTGFPFRMFPIASDGSKNVNCGGFFLTIFESYSEDGLSLEFKFALYSDFPSESYVLHQFDMHRVMRQIEHVHPF